MGQYHYVVNLDKKEFLHPHKFNDGLKIREFGCSSDGTMTGLALLLSNSGNGRGGGDFNHGESLDWLGRWAGDRIVIAGDYAKPGDKCESEEPDNTIYGQCDGDTYVDISYDVVRELVKGHNIRTE
jgi:hypothetical protein